MPKYKKGQILVLRVDGDTQEADYYNDYNHPVCLFAGDKLIVEKMSRSWEEGHHQLCMLVPQAVEHYGLEGALWWMSEEAFYRTRKKIV